MKNIVRSKVIDLTKVKRAYEKFKFNFIAFTSFIWFLRMKLIGMLFLILLSCEKGSVAPGARPIYYIDSRNGSDTNTGTNETLPLKTLSYVSSLNFPAGAVIYLKKGEVWNEQLSLQSSNITIDSYGSGSNPIIDGSVEVSGWTNEGAGLYSKVIALNSGEGLGNISENGTLMNFLAWSTNAPTTFSSATSGTFSYDYGLSKIYIKPLLNPSGNTYRISQKIFGINVVNKNDIKIQNISIQRFSLHGINFGNCQRCSVSNVNISNGGGAVVSVNALPPNYLYAGNAIEYNSGSSVGIVENVSISQIFDSGISPQTYTSQVSSSQFVFQNSTIDRCGFAGLEISVLSLNGSVGSMISNVQASGLVITNSGLGWSGRRYGTEGYGIRIVADSSAGTMSDISIDSSTISGSVGDGIKLAGEVGTVRLSRLKIKNNLIGINVSSSTASTLKLNLSSSLIYNNLGYGINYNAPLAAGFNIYQNTFYNNNLINFAVFNQSGEAKIQNNIFYSSLAMTHLYVASTLSGAVVNNNCYNNVTNMFGYNSLTASTVAAFNAQTGFEASGVAGTVGLASAGSENFTLTGASSCRGIGAINLGILLDYSGRVFLIPPSAGAYEY